jgi:precorrin-6B methylase 2
MLWWEIILIGAIVLVCVWFLLSFLAIAIGGSFSAPFVPSGRRTVQKMLELAELKPNDVVWDLGSGDGRLLLAAARQGVKESHGVEIALPLYLFSKILCHFRKPKGTEISIHFGNLFHEENLREIQKADVILVFLMPNAIDEIFTKLWPHLKPGCRVVSHAFTPKKVKIKPDKIIKAQRGLGGNGKVTVFVKK